MSSRYLCCTAMLLGLVGLVSSQAQTAANRREAKISAAIRAVLDAQREAWNRGDIEGYMNGYARSDNTVFISGDNVTRGWQTVLARYKKNYDSLDKMGKLTFSQLETTLLANDAAVVIGRWHLLRADDEPQGRFTLIFRKTRVEDRSRPHLVGSRIAKSGPRTRF